MMIMRMMCSQRLIFMKTYPMITKQAIKQTSPMYGSTFQQCRFVLRYTRCSMEQRYGSVVSDPRLNCLGCVSLRVV